MEEEGIDDLVQCVSCEWGHYSHDDDCPIHHSCYMHHEKQAKEVSVDEVARDGRDEDLEDERTRIGTR